jgi:hypothetical protein
MRLRYTNDPVLLKLRWEIRRYRYMVMRLAKAMSRARAAKGTSIRARVYDSICFVPTRVEVVIKLSDGSHYEANGLCKLDAYAALWARCLSAARELPCRSRAVEAAMEEVIM